jgi:hypothetical protein
MFLQRVARSLCGALFALPSIEELASIGRSALSLVPHLYILQNFRVKSGRNSDQAELLFQPAVSLMWRCSSGG